ncbi:unnamed protein product, partial [Pylaiella littoralis]
TNKSQQGRALHFGFKHAIDTANSVWRGRGKKVTTRQLAPPSAMLLLYVKAKEARGLKDVQTFGRQDPFLKLWVGRGGTKVRTRVHVDGGKNAKWDESFAFNLENIAPDEYLHFEVTNKNVMDTKNIGMGKVPLAAFGPAETSAWHAIYCPKGKHAGLVLLEGRRGSRNVAIGHHEFSFLNHPLSSLPSPSPLPPRMEPNKSNATPSSISVSDHGAPPSSAMMLAACCQRPCSSAPMGVPRCYGVVCGILSPMSYPERHQMPAVYPQAAVPSAGYGYGGGGGGGSSSPPYSAEHGRHQRAASTPASVGGHGESPLPSAFGYGYGGGGGGGDGAAVGGGVGGNANAVYYGNTAGLGGGGASAPAAAFFQGGSHPPGTSSSWAAPAAAFAPPAPSAPPAPGPRAPPTRAGHSTGSVPYNTGGSGGGGGGSPRRENRLPPGWEKKFAVNGRPYFLDHK